MSSIHTQTFDLHTEEILASDHVDAGRCPQESRAGQQLAVVAASPEVQQRGGRRGADDGGTYSNARSEADEASSSPIRNSINDNSSVREKLTETRAEPPADVCDSLRSEAQRASTNDGAVAVGALPTATSPSGALMSTSNSHRSHAVVRCDGSPPLLLSQSAAQSAMPRDTLSPSTSTPTAVASINSPSLVSDSLGACSFGLDAGSVFGSLPMLTSPGYMLAGHRNFCDVVDKLQLPLAEAEPDGVISCSMSIGEPHADSQLTVETATISVGTAGDRVTAASARSVASSKSVASAEAPGPNVSAIRRSGYRRMLTLAFIFFFAYAPFFSLRNVQGSLSTDPSLGMLSIGCLYALPWFGAVCSYPIVHLIGPKWSIACASAAYVLFAASNFHFAKYVALPASLLQGFGIGLIWAAEGLYMVNAASEFAAATGKSLSNVIERFNTILYGPYLSSNVIGNGLSSIILRLNFPGDGHGSDVGAALLGESWPANAKSYNSSADGYYNYSGAENASLTVASCGIAFTFSERTGPSLITMAQKYTLVSVMTLMASVALLLSLFVLDRLPNARLTGARNVFTSLRDMLTVCVDLRLLLLFPMFVYYGFSGSLLFGDFTRAFVTCSNGASTVGLTFVVGAALAVLSSFLGSATARRVGRPPVMIAACVVASAAFIIMLLWTPTPGGGLSVTLFLPVAIWCLSDGILSTNTNALQSLIFKERYPSSCAAYLLVYGGSVAMGAVTTAFQWMTLLSKTYMVIGMLVTALVSYATLEVLLRRGILKSE